MKQLKYFIALLAFAGLISTGCSSSENPISASNNDASLSSEASSFDEVANLAKHGKRNNGIVTVVHGVPGLVVDVYVNGTKTLPGFEPGTVTDPLSLPEGNYDIVIVPENGDPANPAISGSVFLPARANASIVAHLDQGGVPKLSVYVNDLSKIRRTFARVVVRHVAAVDPVDVLLYRKKFFGRKKLVGKLESIANSEEAQADLFGWFRYSATINPAGTDDVAVGPADLKLKPNKANIYYAIGSLQDKTFELLKQEIRLPLKKYRRQESEEDDSHYEGEDD